MKESGAIQRIFNIDLLDRKKKNFSEVLGLKV